MSQIAKVAERLARLARTKGAAAGTAILALIVLMALGLLPTGLGLALAIGIAVWSLASVPGRAPRAEAGMQASDPPVPSADEPGHVPLWRQVLDAIADPALVLDSESHVVAANSSAAALFPAMQDRHIALVHRAPEILDAVERTARLGQPHAFEIEMVVPIERRLAGMTTPLNGGEAARSRPAMLIVLRDLTEAERLAQMRADFVANASHELRTPLAALKGFIETLQGAAKDDPKAREQFLGIMQTEAARMSRLIDDLLSLSRIEMREHVHPTGRVDLNVVASTAVMGLRQLAATNGVTLGMTPLAGDATVAGDVDELVQVVQNLVQNGIKYGRKDGKVRVGVREEGRRIAIEVADDGIGITAEHLPRLTERFYRVSAKDSRARGGTGLGLAIVKHIVNRHRGELRIESTPGTGSTFTVLLPIPAR